MTYANQREVVPFIGTVDGFEYRIASLTFAMIKQERKSVRFLSRPRREDTQQRRADPGRGCWPSNTTYPWWSRWRTALSTWTARTC